ncbi:MAG: plasmid recombination protein, partial [Cyanobacteria bacterium J06649_11]
MAYAIFLTKKLKTGGQIAGSASHVQRDRETPNANPYKENIWLMGNPKQDLVQDTFNHIGNQTIRKNAVLCVELVLSASPEFF